MYGRLVFLLLRGRRPPISTLFPYTTLFRSRRAPSRARAAPPPVARPPAGRPAAAPRSRSEEHTSELQSQSKVVCRLLLVRKNRLPAAARAAGRGPAPRVGTARRPIHAPGLL